jgi:small subunit ribosomal protein S7
MPRRARVVRHELLPDQRYQSILVTKLINYVMKDGKKEVASALIYAAMEILASRTGEEPLASFEKVIRTLEPQVEVKPKRVGGATYQVPIEVRGDRRTNLALQWMLTTARARRGSAFPKRLADEMSDILNGQGAAWKKREDTHRMAEANRAFAHYARF